ncbi:MAG: 2-oxo acid dehydrogenase subunit E2 [Flavobacteriales bacterium]|nr:2-oxo acid dehydrogenase subunit E2 [Flavobacteriales bacterium]
MAQIELLLPKMGESVAEATIIKWLVEEGQSVEADDPIVEIATDKVDSEVPAPEDGVLIKKMVNEGDVVEVGQVIAIIGTEGDTAASTPAPEPAKAPEPATSAPEVTVAAAAAPSPAVLETVSAPLDVNLSKNGPSGRFYSPLVRSIAKKEGIPMTELESVAGTGQDGRVTKKDILAYVENRGNAPAAAPIAVAKEEKPVATAPAPSSNGAAKKKESSSAGIPTIKPMAVSAGPNDEVIEMDRMRKLIADHMVMSKHVSPHVTSFVEADVTNIVNWRNKVKKSFQEKEGEKLTFTPIFIEAITKAIKDYPGVNASVDGHNVIMRKNINVGMAAALPSGNLIVPVIKNADQFNLVGLAKQVNDLAGRARANQLQPDEIQGGTFTVTNVGTFGNVMGTPIINQPQVAIMALGAIRKKPAVMETEHGDVIAIRHMMFLSHSYDHRVVDGMLGGSFLRRVADYLEAFDPNREIG